MKISGLGEFGLIDRIGKRFKKSTGNDIVLGIGDDAAVLKTPKNAEYALLTTDTLVENVHFDLRYTSFYSLGWKLTASNISDIAAMGGKPKYALITLGLKDNMKVKDIDDFYKGVEALGNKFNVKVVGGDIISSPKSLFFTMGIYGVTDKAITRNGARPGDNIYYIGPLGNSAAGLKVLKDKKRFPGSSKLVWQHLMPKPLLNEGRKISKYASSMIDNSDGLARCLIEICRSSKVGAEVLRSKIISPEVKRASISLKIDPLNLVLDGGEDYGLMFTSKQNNIRIPGIRLIGKIVKKRKIYLVEKDMKKVLSDRGFEHF